MGYLGGKFYSLKYILPILNNLRIPGQNYVEPFSGGYTVIQHISNPRIGNDIHRYITALYKAVIAGWDPPTEVSKEYYTDIRYNRDSYPDELVGFVGFFCSFGGIWMGSYANPNKKSRNYALNGYRTVKRTANRLRGCKIENVDYRDLAIPSMSLIYCDPPYRGVTGYKDVPKFDHDQFWQWCRDRSCEGHTVVISELSAPSDFSCIAEWSLKTIVSRCENLRRTERLFMYSP